MANIPVTYIFLFSNKTTENFIVHLSLCGFKNNYFLTVKGNKYQPSCGCPVINRPGNNVNTRFAYSNFLHILNSVKIL